MAEVIERLQREVAVLQRWLDRQQQEDSFKGLVKESMTLVPIVESMLESRRMLLVSLQSQVERKEKRA